MTDPTVVIEAHGVIVKLWPGETDPAWRGFVGTRFSVTNADGSYRGGAGGTVWQREAETVEASR